MENFLVNTLSIDIQPKQNFHYRYVSELGNTHGVLIGQVQAQNSVIEDTYPTVRLQLPSNGQLNEVGIRRDFFVLCSLHSYNTVTGPQSLSPHLLKQKGNRDPAYDLIFAPMEENRNNSLERSFQLKDYVLVRLKSDDYHKSLSGKRTYYESLQLPLEFDQLKGALNIDDKSSVKKSAILNVCLGFTIFERDSNTQKYRLYKETIYSDNIYHGDDLRIHELCNTKGPVAGDTKVHILIKLQSGYKYFVRMFKYSSDMTAVVWETFVPITDDDIFSNAAITYTLPAGPTDESTDEIEVMIEIVVDRSSYRSKAVKFWYMNTNDNESGRRKRARPIENTATTAQVTEIVTLPNLYAINPNLIHCTSSLQEVAQIEPTLQEAIDGYDMQIGYLPPQAVQLPSTSSHDTDSDTVLANLPFLRVDTLNTSMMAQPLDASQDDYYIIQNFQFSNGDPAGTSTVSEEPSKTYYSQDRCESVGTRKEKITTELPKNAIDFSALIKRRIDQILDDKPTSDTDNINIKGLNDRSGNTIFHDALMDMDTLVYLYRLQKKSSKLEELVLKARNTYRQNLLHYACILDKASCLRPLVGMGIALNEQDSLGRTPLHIAIEHSNKDCMLKLQNLIKDHSKYPSEVATQLVKMLQVYSHKGHTVLHAAAIENQYDLVEVMLEFCKTHNVDILQYEALGNGDSLVHLIVKRNLVDMIALIRQYVPQYLTVQNYPGQTVFDVPELSTEMFEALSIK